ncbi:MAG: segregation and condensation protein B [Parasphingorhabdus sp.]
MSVNQDTLKHIVEAAVMAADAPLSVRQILSLFPEEACPAKEEISQAIIELQQDCEDRGVELKQVGSGFRYQTRDNLALWLRKLNEGRPPKYSRAMLETLAIVAYRQPVTRGDIEEIRGVAVSSDIMRVLQERDWVKQVGVRDVPGHPGLYGTTPEFLGYFNLESLKELPVLIEQRDLADIARDQNIQLPLELNTEDESQLENSEGEDTTSDKSESEEQEEQEEQEDGLQPSERTHNVTDTTVEVDEEINS